MALPSHTDQVFGWHQRSLPHLRHEKSSSTYPSWLYRFLFWRLPRHWKSTLAYVFFYHTALLSWYSKLSSCVLTCTNHAEYAALALGAKECEWLLVLFGEFECADVHKPIPMYVDNSGVISMVANPVDHQADKHVQISQHYTRELACPACYSSPTCRY